MTFWGLFADMGHFKANMEHFETQYGVKPIWDNFRHYGTFLENFGAIFTNMEHFWRHFVTTGLFVSMGHFVTTGHFWGLFATTRHFWGHFIIIGHFWDIPSYLVISPLWDIFVSPLWNTLSHKDIMGHYVTMWHHVDISLGNYGTSRRHYGGHVVTLECTLRLERNPGSEPIGMFHVLCCQTYELLITLYPDQTVWTPCATLCHQLQQWTRNEASSTNNEREMKRHVQTMNEKWNANYKQWTRNKSLIENMERLPIDFTCKQWTRNESLITNNEREMKV